MTRGKDDRVGDIEAQLAEIMGASNDFVVKAGKIYSGAAEAAFKAAVGGAGIADVGSLPVKIASGGGVAHWF